MNIFQAIVLGIVQGVAEFLPISSSGHLVLVQEILGVLEPDLVFEIALHFATLLAVLVYFWKRILQITLRDLFLICVASIPAAFVVIFFEEYIFAAFGSILFVGFALYVTGILNIYTEKKLLQESQKMEQKTELSIFEAFIIGLFQAAAILPGISRSGATVAGGILQKVDRSVAFEFSFLMIIPVVLGATLLQLLGISDGSISISGSEFQIVVGCVAAFISGLASLKILEFVITKAKLSIFGIYCFIVGTLSILSTVL